jgi:multisubunit Na+/H+ antiporter MnhB subunit
MPSKYEVETKEIDFLIKMTTNILILFAFTLFMVSILFPDGVLILTLIFTLAVGWLIIATKGMIKQWKKKWGGAK